MYDIVIIGAGISGMFLARECQKSGMSVVVLEARKSIGGRVKTIRDEHGNPIYEAGAWRVGLSHRRVRKLAQEYGLEEKPVTSSLPHAFTSTSACSVGSEDIKESGMSVWDKNTFVTAKLGAADCLDRNTGYMGHADMASASRSYGVNERHPDKTYVIWKSGLDSIVGKLNEGLHVQLETMVESVEHEPEQGSYIVHAIHTKRGKVLYTTKRVCIAVPPHACRHWRITRDHIWPTICSVSSNRLMHIYAKVHSSNAGFSRRLPGLKIVDQNNPLAQIISGDHDARWFQISYSAGRLAMYWQRIWTLYGVEKLKLELQRQLYHVCYTHGLQDVHWIPDITEVRCHYWEHAVHFWKPAPGLDPRRASVQAAYPNPVSMPFVYMANEAYSTHQGWMEGALESAENVLMHIFTPVAIPSSLPLVHHANIQDRFGKTWVLVSDRVVNVSNWLAVHPGSREAIEPYLGKDVSRLMHHIPHSENAYALIHSMTVAWNVKQENWNVEYESN